MGHILQHSSAPVKFDPPVTADSIARAIAAAQMERDEINRLIQLRDDDRLELSAIVDRHGWKQVSDWLMGLQAMQDARRI